MEDINANNFVISNAEIVDRARKSLKNRWGKSVLLMLLVFLLEFLVPVALTVLLPKKFTGLINGLKPLLIFLCNAFLILWAVKLVKYDEWLGDFSKNTFKKYGSFMGGSTLVGILTCLWTLLLIIPGIFAAFNYAMTLYILMDKPAMPVADAIKYSKKIMYGSRWKLFCLNFRLLGWWVLIILSTVVSIPLFALFAGEFAVILSWLIFLAGCLLMIPYTMIVNAHFYNYVRTKYEYQNGELPVSEYQGMSVANTVMLSILIFVLNAGIFYLTSLLRSIAAGK